MIIRRKAYRLFYSSTLTFQTSSPFSDAMITSASCTILFWWKVDCSMQYDSVGKIGICCMPFAMFHKGLVEVSIWCTIVLCCTKIDQSVLHFPDVFTDFDVPQGNASHEFLCFQYGRFTILFFLFYVIPTCTPSSGGHALRILQFFLKKLEQNVSKK